MARCITLLAFGPFSKGQVIPDVPANQAREWVRLNRVRIETEGQTRQQPSPVNRMMTPMSSKRRGNRGS
jgi:hypothetical protein